jgi:hypothetical protein
MITIGIIDDNQEQRDSFKDAIELYLKKAKREGVEVIDIEHHHTRVISQLWVRRTTQELH